MSIDHKLQRIQVDSFEISDELVYRFFNSLPDNERETALLRAIRIGVLATMEDRFSAFLSKTTDDLGVQLENLKLLFDMKQEIFHKTAIKGVAAENDILEFLETYIDHFHLGDVVSLSGTSKGLLKNNKTGDILAYVGGENSGKKVAIECKFDKSIKLGDVDSLDIASNKYDTAWSQLLETTVNRGANTSIIVFDKTLTDRDGAYVQATMRYLGWTVNRLKIITSDLDSEEESFIRCLLNARTVDYSNPVHIRTTKFSYLTKVRGILKMLEGLPECQQFNTLKSFPDMTGTEITLYSSTFEQLSSNDFTSSTYVSKHLKLTIECLLNEFTMLAKSFVSVASIL